MQKTAQKKETIEKKSEPHDIPIVKEFTTMKETSTNPILPIIIIAIAIIISGAFTGYILANTTGRGASSGKTTNALGDLLDSVGRCDSKTPCDDQSPEGILREGGTEGGDGTHYLERPGGESQNVYLTSATLPLDDYVGKEVKVWGQTFAAETAGWFMDVAKLELK